MELTDRERAIEKIKKLLALADDKGATANEAATAARQAESLLRKHNLDKADVIAKELKSAENIVWKYIRPNMFKNNGAFIKKIQIWPQWIAVPCGELYDCHVGQRLLKDEGHVIAIYGYVTDVEICAWIYDYLLDCVRYESLKLTEYEAAKAGWSIKKYRESFRIGMAQELTERLREAVYAKQNADKQSSTSTALVVLKRQAIEEKFGEFTYTTSKQVEYARDAADKGRDAARKISLTPNVLNNKSNNTKQIKGK